MTIKSGGTVIINDTENAENVASLNVTSNVVNFGGATNRGFRIDANGTIVIYGGVVDMLPRSGG